MDQHHHAEYQRTACRAPDPERQAPGEAAHRPPPGDPASARRDGSQALTGLAARQHDDQSDVPVCHAEYHASRYPAQAGTISWHLLADGYTITWAPAPAGCSLTLGRHGPHGEHDAYRGTGPTMQRAWDQVRAQLGHGEPQADGGTSETPGAARGSVGPVPR